MARNHRSARTAGTAFETWVAEWLATTLHDDRIERRTRNGRQDRGDITGLHHAGNRIVVEVKNTSRLNLAGWVDEAELERGNDDAQIALVIHKRRGRGRTRMGEQYVTTTLADLATLLTGHRPTNNPHNPDEPPPGR